MVRVMLFKPFHIEKIREGTKTATRRTWDRAKVKVGNRYPAKTEMFESNDEADCWIEVTDVYQEKLGDLTYEDAQKEGGYTPTQFRDSWRDIVGEWEPDMMVYVVEFEYVGTEQYPEYETQDALEW